MLRNSFLLLTLVMASACTDSEEEKEPPIQEVDPLDSDDDGDGFSENQGDCDDSNADISPSATEICDEIDNDCDSLIDDEDDNLDASTGSEFYADTDGDGYGDGAAGAWACVQPESSVDNMDDCDDNNADINPDATEVCDGGIDNDCDGLADDDDDDVDASDGVTLYEDYDGDGYGDPDVSMMFCVASDGYVADMTDCNDLDADLNQDDNDADGLSTCDWDCDDFNNEIGATDEDNDGSIACYNDCDDTDPLLNSNDVDADGYSMCDGDCDDNDATVGIEDADGDGFSACYNDCDDNSDTTYPGAAYNEADPTACLDDADGDGYGNYIRTVSVSCIDIEMTDTYGDGWDGNSIDVYEDGTMTASYANEDLDGGTGSETQIETHCMDSATVMVELVYTAGSWASEVEFTISDSDGQISGSGEGFGTSTSAAYMEWDGEYYYDGEVFLSIDDVANIPLMTGGTDCDDTDGTTFGDDDGDGYSACVNDCDDTDATLNGDDVDADGYSTCDGDCDDDNADFNPGVEETYYDGIDSNCDDWSDYDADMDGHDASEYTDSTGTVVTHTGDDCDDDDAAVHPLANEADQTVCYEDNDGDGWGSESPSSSFAEAGTDCYDSSWSSSAPYIYPGAAYNEPDVDGDGVVDCTQDSDEDGYGDMDSFNADVNGTDCDDDDFDLNPGVDFDGDGANACEDCDDDDATAVGLMAYTDGDGDGFGSDSSGVFVCSLDEDGDGVDDYVSVGGDCYDVSWSSSAPYIYPGAAYNEPDVDGDGVVDCTEDSDEDGYGDMDSFNADVNGTDCDDTDELLNPGIDDDSDGTSVCDDCDDNDATVGGTSMYYVDYDGDSYGGFEPIESCSEDYYGDGSLILVSTTGDCDDGSDTTYPGAAELDSTTACLPDGDGDGYGQAGSCYQFWLFDSYGDGWDSSYIDIMIDGTSMQTYTISGSSGYAYWCASGTTMEVSYYNGTSYNYEVSFEIWDSFGNQLLSTGTSPDTGVLLTHTMVDNGGTDSDDTDSSVQ